MSVVAVTSKQVLYEVWPFVVIGINRIREKTKHSQDIDFIKNAILKGYAELHLVEEDSKLKGFFVTEIISDRRGKFLNIWLLAGNGLWKYRNMVMSYIDKYAEEHFLPDIQFSTPRRGWIKAMETWFKPSYTVFSRNK